MEGEQNAVVLRFAEITKVATPQARPVVQVTIECDKALLSKEARKNLGDWHLQENFQIDCVIALPQSETPTQQPEPEAEEEIPEKDVSLEQPEPKPKPAKAKAGRPNQSLDEMSPAQKLHTTFFKNERFWAYLSDQRDTAVTNEEQAKLVFKTWTRVESTSEITEERLEKLAAHFNNWLKENREAVTHG